MMVIMLKWVSNLYPKSFRSHEELVFEEEFYYGLLSYLNSDLEHSGGFLEEGDRIF